MNIIDLVQSQISDDMIDQLSHQIGGTRQQTQAATNGVISTLVAALSQNAQQPGGADALNAALDRDHDGSILDDAMGFLLGNRQPQNTKTLNGTGILNHVLGGKQESANNMLGKLTGLDKSQIAQLMITLAPLIMGAIGKVRNQQQQQPRLPQQQQQSSPFGGIGDLLNRTVQSSSNKRSELGLIGKFLDKDGDGSVMDDLMGMGMNALLRK
jgi:hypothetical protein